MRIPLNREDGVPLYKQIEAYLRQAIGTGSLAPGARLPATRQLARGLGVNRMTVETAYAELRADGLIVSRMGSGSYVQMQARLLPMPQDEDTPRAWPEWQTNLPKRTLSFSTAGMRQALALGMHPDPVDLSSGAGDPKLFPNTAFRKAIQDALRAGGSAALDYGDQSGYLPLRRVFADMLISQGLYARPDSILVTSGAQQAIQLVARLLTAPGDAVVVEQPTYSSVLQLFRMLGLSIIGIPVDERGMQTDGLDEILVRHRPKLIYTMPTFHNPTGATMAAPRRAALVAAACRHGVAILEDDYAGDLRYEGRAQPALKAIDSSGTVIYTGTFSKLLMPGLRIGFLVADGPAYDHLACLKQSQDLATSNLLQRGLAAYLNVGRYQEHIDRSRRTYRRRRDALLQAARAYLPSGVRIVAVPQGGLFAWLRLPDGVKASALLPGACAAGMAYMPGTAFFAEPERGEQFIRLNFALQSPAVLAEAMRRLGAALAAYCEPEDCGKC